MHNGKRTCIRHSPGYKKGYKKTVVTIDITINLCYNLIVIINITLKNNYQEVQDMGNYSKVSVAQDARTELHDKLSLTGAEISINNLPAGAGVPFVHSHKNNEEIYVILSGKGKAVVDGETIELAAGDWIRIAPAGKRQFFAANDEAICFACIQVKENSLESYTKEDAVIYN